MEKHKMGIQSIYYTYADLKAEREYMQAMDNLIGGAITGVGIAVLFIFFISIV